MAKLIKVDSQLFKEAQDVLDDIGIEVETVVRMALKRVVKDKNISFLTAPVEKPVIPKEQPQPPVSPQATFMTEEKPMTKSRAIALFEQKGIKISKNATYASKNRAAYNYWANPYFFALDREWFLILNDWIRKELHLFVIPADTLHKSQLVARADQPEMIDLQICYNDPQFTDNRSKISFARFLVKTIRY